MITSSFHFIKSAATTASLNDPRQRSNQHTICSHHIEISHTAQIFNSHSILIPHYVLYIIQTIYNFKQTLICWRKRLTGIQRGIISSLFHPLSFTHLLYFTFSLLKESAVFNKELPFVQVHENCTFSSKRRDNT